MDVKLCNVHMYELIRYMGRSEREGKKFHSFHTSTRIWQWRTPMSGYIRCPGAHLFSLVPANRGRGG
jgi:hypothetical protein